MPSARIVYLALADARGHLMRAHLIRCCLAERGIAVDIVTTSHAGREFLETLGTPSQVLSEHFAVAFDGCHDLSRAKTDACVLRYYLDPRRGLADLKRLERFAVGADLVVCDSLHPALLVAPWLSELRVVHVFAENIWNASIENFSERGPGWLDRIYRRTLNAMRDAAFANVVHTLDRSAVDARAIALSPILPAPRRTPEAVRAELGIGPRDRLAAVYLNPHFTDPRVADAILRVLSQLGFRVHAVGEGYRDRPSWLACDRDFASVVRAADLLVSGAGMGAIAQSRVFGTPLVALLGRQPEQLKNIAQMRALGARFEAVDLAQPALERALSAAISKLLREKPSTPTASALDVQRAWADTFVNLVDLARKETPSHEQRVTRSRNQQPRRRRQRAAHGEPRPFARTPGAPNPSALVTRGLGHHP